MTTDETDDREDSATPDFTSPAPPPVTLTESEHDDGDDEPEEKVRDPKTGKWSAKKQPRDRQRGKMRGEMETLKEQNTSLQAKLDAFTQSSTAERRAMLEMVQRATAQRAPEQQQDPASGEIDAIRQEFLTERELLARDPKRTTERYDKLSEKLQRAIFKSELAEWQKANGGQQQRPQQSPDVQAAIRQSQMESEFPWIAGNEKAMRAAASYRNFLVESGKPSTIETLRLAIAHVGAQMGLGGSNAPTQRQRQAFAGPGPGSVRQNGAPRQVQVDPRMLAGTGLSKDRLSRALFEKDDE